MQGERGAQAGVARGVGGGGVCSGSCGWRATGGGRCRLTAPRPLLPARCTMPSLTLTAVSGATGTVCCVPGILGGSSLPVALSKQEHRRGQMCQGTAALPLASYGPWDRLSLFSRNVGDIVAELLAGGAEH